ncbi:MAG: hypothetical protein RL497_1628 [Pseudomonadota bacterium]|jgi:outer membrane biosynthesis protein TonB
MSAYLSPNLLLPWASIPQENRRLNTFLAIGLVVFILFFAAIRWIELPPPPPVIPVATTVMVVEQPVVLPPPPKPVEPPPPEVVEPPEVKPEPVPEKPKPEPKPVPVKPEPVKTPPKETVPGPAAAEVKLNNARKQAAQAGVMQAQNELAAMRDSLDINDVSKPTDTASAPGANTAATVDRAVISSGALAKSGGISVAALSKDTGGGGGLGGRKGEAVQNKLKDADQAAAAKQAAASAGGGKGSRTDEELKRILDAAKARITAVYYRALDDDPTLQGRIVFKLTIDPSGAVSAVQLVSSALKNDDLQRKITALLRGLNFGARDVVVYTQTVPIDLFPS